MTIHAIKRFSDARPGEDREREILGGLTLAEKVRLEGGGFWIRLTDSQANALKQHLRECSFESANRNAIGSVLDLPADEIC